MSTTTADSTTVTVEHGATRKLVKVVARKAALGALGLLVIQNVVQLPAQLAPLAPLAHVLGLHITGVA